MTSPNSSTDTPTFDPIEQLDHTDFGPVRTIRSRKWSETTIQMLAEGWINRPGDNVLNVARAKGWRLEFVMDWTADHLVRRVSVYLVDTSGATGDVLLGTADRYPDRGFHHDLRVLFTQVGQQLRLLV